MPLKTLQSSARPTLLTFGKQGLMQSICFWVNQNKPDMGIPPFHHESLSRVKGNSILRNDRSADNPPF
jgi:hypothetical protein